MSDPIVLNQDITYFGQPGVVRIECFATKFSLFQDYECVYLGVEEFQLSLENSTCPYLDIMADFKSIV